MFEFKWVILMGVCVFFGGIFNNYVVVQGCDYIVLVDVYLLGCLFSLDMFIDVVFKICEQIQYWLFMGYMFEVEVVKEKKVFDVKIIFEQKGFM